MAQSNNRIDFDNDLFRRNKQLWTMEQLAPYRDQWVAWSLDGKSIVAHHEDPLEVVRITKEMGMIGGDFLLDFLPPDSEVWI